MSHAAHELLERWRQRAELLDRYAPVAAEAFRHAAGELEEALDAKMSELLSLTDAAAECGYTPDHLGRLVRDGVIENHGRPGAPRVRRVDLPAKGKRRRESSDALREAKLTAVAGRMGRRGRS